MNFIVNYIKDMKNDSFHFILSKEMTQALKSWNADIHKLTDEQVGQLR
jgi:hypothetical protein